MLEIKQPMFFNTPLGDAIALFIIDYGWNENTVWVCVLESTGEVKHFNSEQIRLCTNKTFQINVKKDQIANPVFYEYKKC